VSGARAIFVGIVGGNGAAVFKLSSSAHRIKRWLPRVREFTHENGLTEIAFMQDKNSSFVAGCFYPTQTETLFTSVTDRGVLEVII
jgi:hypothetical protein